MAVKGVVNVTGVSMKSDNSGDYALNVQVFANNSVDGTQFPGGGGYYSKSQSPSSVAADVRTQGKEVAEGLGAEYGLFDTTLLIGLPVEGMLF